MQRTGPKRGTLSLGCIFMLCRYDPLAMPWCWLKSFTLHRSFVEDDCVSDSVSVRLWPCTSVQGQRSARLYVPAVAASPRSDAMQAWLAHCPCERPLPIANFLTVWQLASSAVKTCAKSRRSMQDGGIGSIPKRACVLKFFVAGWGGSI